MAPLSFGTAARLVSYGENLIHRSIPCPTDHHHRTEIAKEHRPIIYLPALSTDHTACLIFFPSTPLNVAQVFVHQAVDGDGFDEKKYALKSNVLQFIWSKR